MLEIEMTFLVKKLPRNLRQFHHVKIKQGYLSPSPSPLRVRQRGDDFELAKKLPSSGKYALTIQKEILIKLTEYEFEKLWKLVDRTLVKTRYLIPLEEGLTAELDVFGDKLSGLAFVEVEFKNKKQLESFKPPDWFGKDVTVEDFAANSFLAGKSFKEIKKLIEKA